MDNSITHISYKAYYRNRFPNAITTQLGFIFTLFELYYMQRLLFQNKEMHLSSELT